MKSLEKKWGADVKKEEKKMERRKKRRKHGILGVIDGGKRGVREKDGCNSR